MAVKFSHPEGLGLDDIEIRYIPSSLVLLMQEAIKPVKALAGLELITLGNGSFYDGPEVYYIIKKRTYVHAQAKRRYRDKF